jgi:hypothetical protein
MNETQDHHVIVNRLVMQNLAMSPGEEPPHGGCSMPAAPMREPVGKFA